MSRLYETFKAAKQYLITEDLKNLTDNFEDKNSFICHAIRRAWDYGNISFEDMSAAITLIEARLGKSSDGCTNTVVTFLEEAGHLTEMPEFTSEDFLFKRRQLQLYRHRWLDALIEEFKNA